MADEGDTIDCAGIGPDLSAEARRDLQTVLNAWISDAFVLAQYGQNHDAALIGALVRDVERAAEDFLRFVPESEARLRGAKLAWLRRNFATWEQDGHARKVGAVREYRAIMLPRVTPTSVAREAGRRGERLASRRSKRS